MSFCWSLWWPRRQAKFKPIVAQPRTPTSPKTQRWDDLMPPLPLHERPKRPDHSTRPPKQPRFGATVYGPECFGGLRHTTFTSTSPGRITTDNPITVTVSKNLKTITIDVAPAQTAKYTRKRRRKSRDPLGGDLVFSKERVSYCNPLNGYLQAINDGVAWGKPYVLGAARTVLIVTDPDACNALHSILRTQ